MYLQDFGILGQQSQKKLKQSEKRKNEFQGPEIINMVKVGIDYEHDKVVFVAAYWDKLTDIQHYQWKLRYQVHEDIFDENENRILQVVKYKDKVDGIDRDL